MTKSQSQFARRPSRASLALAGLVACASPERAEDTTASAPDAVPTRADAGDPDDAAKSPAPDPAQASAPTTQKREGALSCEQLRTRGHEDATEAGLYVLLCPDAEASARELRAALQLVTRADTSAAVLAHSSDAPAAELAELAALARLATEPPTRFAAPTDDEVPLPRADEAVLTPLSEDVLVLLAHATRRLTAGGLGARERLEARGLVARIHMDAMRALGMDPTQPLTPMAQQLAGPTLAHTLAFCRGYWSLGGGRLNARARELEMAMLELVRSVDRTAPHELDAQLTDAHHQAWRYLRASDVRRRVASQLARREKRALGFESPAALHGVESLAPFPRQLERLVAAGLADLAIEEALAVARDRDGFGIDPVEAHLLELLGRHGFAENESHARRAFDRLRRERRAPPALGPEPYDLETPAAWTSLDELRAHLDHWLQLAEGASGLERRHALARAALLMHGRPDLRGALAARRTALPAELVHLVVPPLPSDEDAVQRRRGAISPGGRSSEP